MCAVTGRHSGKNEESEEQRRACFPRQQDKRQAGQSRELCEEEARLPGCIYLGSRSWGSLAVGGLSAGASSFGHGCGQGWVLGRRRGADYDRGRHREVGTLCREGQLAPLLQGATHTGSEGAPPEAVGSHLSLPPPLNLMEDCREAQGRQTPEPVHCPVRPIHPRLTHTPNAEFTKYVPVNLSISSLICQSIYNVADIPDSPE